MLRSGSRNTLNRIIRERDNFQIQNPNTFDSTELWQDDIISIMELTKIKDMIKNFPVEFAYLYGSFAEGVNRRWSDFGIAVIAKEAVKPEAYLNLELEIAKSVDSVLTATESDVRVFNRAPLNYKIQVVQNGKLLYSADEKKRVDFETSVRDEYFDFLPKREEYRSSFLDGIEKGGLLWSTRKR